MAKVASFPFKSPLPRTVVATVVFLGGAALLVASRTAAGYALGAFAGSAGLAMAFSLVNLLRHEGWAVVVTEAGVELLDSALGSTRRAKLTWEEIASVGVSPSPPEPPQVLLFELTNGEQRWVRREDLADEKLEPVINAVVLRLKARPNVPRGTSVQ
jgi:hypothetical protein